MFSGLVATDYVVGALFLIIVGTFAALRFAPLMKEQPPEDRDVADPS